MADPGFRGPHTTDTFVTSNTTAQPDFKFDASYLKTLPGILKIAQVLFSLLGFICIEVTAFSYLSRGSYYIFVSMTAFWFTGVLLFFYLFHIVERFQKIPWLKIEIVFCVVWVLMYLIAASLTVTFGVEAFKVAGIFGFLAMAAYGLDAFLKFTAIKTGQVAQGVKTTPGTGRY